jgi:atypical dual specificity phosphatase
MDCTVILPNLYLGPCPKNTFEVDTLRRESNITAVLNVQTDEDMHYFNLDWPAIEAHYQSCQIEVRRVPVRDFDELDLRARLDSCVNALNELMQSGHNVYVHCSVGAFRSPSVVIAYLHWYCQWSLDDAELHVRRLRPCSPSVEAIRLATEDRLRV